MEILYILCAAALFGAAVLVAVATFSLSRMNSYDTNVKRRHW